jgi:hypothetical protein
VRVALILTGKLEMLGLADGLGRLFGEEHQFVPIPRTRDRPDLPFNGFTSARLPVPSQHERDSALSTLVDAMVDALWSGGYDLAIVLDDVELCNVGNEHIIIGEFHDAVVRRLERVAHDGKLARALGDRLRECASFHLVRPMIESWIFADPMGAANAGAAAGRLPPRLQQGCDPESFLADDSDYLADDGSACTTWRGLPARYQERQRPEWLKPTYARASHPKRYLAWLCRDPAARNCSSLSEEQASQALVRLSWTHVLEAPHQMKLARALIGDLADGLRCSPEGLDLSGEQASLTSIHTRPGKRVLRNL